MCDLGKLLRLCMCVLYSNEKFKKGIYAEVQLNIRNDPIIFEYLCLLFLCHSEVTVPFHLKSVF